MSRITQQREENISKLAPTCDSIRRLARREMPAAGGARAICSPTDLPAPFGPFLGHILVVAQIWPLAERAAEAIHGGASENVRPWKPAKVAGGGGRRLWAPRPWRARRPHQRADSRSRRRRRLRRGKARRGEAEAEAGARAREIIIMIIALRNKNDHSRAGPPIAIRGSSGAALALGGPSGRACRPASGSGCLAGWLAARRRDDRIAGPRRARARKRARILSRLARFSSAGATRSASS